MLQFEQILALVKTESSTDLIADEQASPKIITVAATDLKKICQRLIADPSSYFDMLSCITAIDNGPQTGTMEVIYHLYSIPFHHHVGLKVILSRDNARVDSVVDVWKTANWHEREAFDMFGIVFNDHPDLRRILMPADWNGYPLRKDYQQQAYYRSIKVEY